MPESWRLKPTPPELGQTGRPDERIATIEDSLRCFTYGLLSCLPVIGAAWLYPAVRRFVHARRRKVEWNPARGYLATGLALASIGWIIALVAWLFVLIFFVAEGQFIVTRDDLFNLLPTVLFLGAIPTFFGLAKAWASVWDGLANLSPQVRWSATTVALIAYAIAGLLAGSETVRNSCSERAGMGIWMVWLLGGFVLLAVKPVRLALWLVWYGVLLVLSYYFATL